MTTYSFTTLNDPSAGPNGSTYPRSINDKGQVIGYFSFLTSQGGGSSAGFLYSNGTWTTLGPASGFTFPVSINDKGQVVGTTNGTGFLYSGGTYTSLSDPSPGAYGTSPTAINDKGQVTGDFFVGAATDQIGFLYSNGSWTTLSDPSAGPSESTSPVSINDNGQVTGSYFNGTTYEGFLYSNGTWTNLIDPSQAANGSTNPVSINDKGQIVGTYDNGSKTKEGFPSYVGFLYSNGTWTTLSDPSAVPGGYTQPESINDKGQVTGFYSISNNIDSISAKGFVYSDGTWSTLSAFPTPPGVGGLIAIGTTDALSINNKGQVAGYYYNGTTQPGFIATPTDVDHKRESPKLTITDHSLSLSAGGTISLPISVSPNDADDTVTVKISGIPSFDTIMAGDGHVVAEKDGTYTFTAADVQSGLTLTSSVDNHAGHESRHDEHRVKAEQSKLTVTAFNTTAGEHAATKPQTITVTNTSPTYTFATLNDPLGTNASAQAINASGEVVGEYFDKANVQHGFLYDAGKYTTIDDPLAVPRTTFATSINASGQIVGYYAAIRSLPGAIEGFLYSEGSYTTIVPPGGPISGGVQPAAINSSDQIVGSFDTRRTEAFLYSGGSFTVLNVGVAEAAYATDINDASQIVGWYADPQGSTHGFLDSGGNITILDDPSSISSNPAITGSHTEALGINASGQVVGFYYDANSGDQSGFLYSSGKYTAIDDPLGVDGTQLTGINAAHQIVGEYFDSKGTEHGFIYNNGTYTTIDPAGSTKIHRRRDSRELASRLDAPEGRTIVAAAITMSVASS